MSSTTGAPHHAAGAVYGDAPVDLPIEPLVRETPDEFRARMDAKPDAAAAARLTIAPAPAKETAPLPVGPAPVPRPRPARASAPLARGTRSDEVVIVTAYVNGDSIPEIARATAHSTSTVRRLLLASGVQLRDDRQARSGRTPKADDPAVVDAVRRLYVDEHLSQEEVAERLSLTRKQVERIMRVHGVPARPSASADPAAARRVPNTLTVLRDEIAAAGLTPATLRAWALEHDVPVTAMGVPSRKVLTAYLRHHAATPDPISYVLPDAPDEQRPVEETERQCVDELAALTAANPAIGHTVDADAIAAAIATEPQPAAAHASPDVSTPALAAEIPDAPTPPIVTALAAIGRLADELAALRPRLTSRDRRAVDATLVALGTPEPSLWRQLVGS